MSAELERVLAELDVEVLELVERGLCGCGCGERLPVKRHARRRYLGEHHRQRQYQRRLEAEARALGVPARLSLRGLEAMHRPGNRPSDAETGPQAPKRRRPAPRPGVTLYLPTVELAERLVRELEAIVAGAYVPGLGSRAEAVPLLEAAVRAVERRRSRAERT
jgi:hypothetical protein